MALDRGLSGNLRHLRLFLAAADLHSLTMAAAHCHVSQPAVTQALAKLERLSGGRLFDRTPQGLFPTERGTAALIRIRRALSILDEVTTSIAPRLSLTLTTPQIEALIAVCEAENFTLAARRLGLSQPTIHRAVTDLEHEAGKNLFDRTAYGLVPSKAAQDLARAGRLALYELRQAEADLAEFDGREVGRIVIGAMPLSRSVVLPRALARFRAERPKLAVQVLDGPYDDLLAGLRRGEIDLLIGALRDPQPIGDIEQEMLFDDHLVLLCGNDHPLLSRQNLELTDLADYPWIVPRSGTPIRATFDALFSPLGSGGPGRIIESGSILLMREMLGVSDHLACISRTQAEAEIGKGLVTSLPFETRSPARPIGITRRKNWAPTAAQRRLMDLLRGAVPEVS